MPPPILPPILPAMRRIRRTVAALLALAATAGTASAVTCRSDLFDGTGYAVCEVRAGEDLRLFLDDAAGAPLGTFERLRETLASGERLVFAMNAGMYHPDRSPVGLYVEAGRQIGRLVRRATGGNFGLRPNGVFCIGPDRLAVVETESFAAHPPDCRYASQSGPMLVIGGTLHPRFLPGSPSRNIRNGVGVSADGRTAWFAISDSPVTFHAFARFFRDRLGARDALYFDGSISRLYAPELGRDDIGFPMGPMVGLVAPG